MSMGETQQAIISIDDDDGIPLDRDQDIGALKERIERAAAETRFVDFRRADGAEVSVLVSPLSRVRIAILPVRAEAVDAAEPGGIDDFPADLF